MKTRTFVLIGIGLTLLSSLFLGLAQVYAMYKFELSQGIGWPEFIRGLLWRPGFKISNTFHGIPHDLVDGVITWFPLLLPAVGLFIIFHPFKKPQRVVLGVLILLTIIDLSWLLQGCGAELNAPEWCYVPTFLHLGLSILSILGAIPLRLAVREELRRAKDEGHE
jgi:hypothetical protein